MNKPLRIRITVEVEVNRDEYNAEYGEEASASDIRAHVKGEVFSAATSAFDNINAVAVKDVR